MSHSLDYGEPLVAKLIGRLDNFRDAELYQVQSGGKLPQYVVASVGVDPRYGAEVGLLESARIIFSIILFSSPSLYFFVGNLEKPSLKYLGIR